MNTIRVIPLKSVGLHQHDWEESEKMFDNYPSRILRRRTWGRLDSLIGLGIQGESSPVCDCGGRLLRKVVVTPARCKICNTTARFPESLKGVCMACGAIYTIQGITTMPCP